MVLVVERGVKPIAAPSSGKMGRL